jgi:glutamate-ammonia-ligase adenylyltransferase
LTRARLILGDRTLARRVRAALRRLVYGDALPRAALAVRAASRRGAGAPPAEARLLFKEIVEVRARMERELGRETRGRLHVKYGRGGLVDIEFLAQALQLVHGHDHVEARQFATTAALAGLARAGVLEPTIATELAERYRFLRRVSAALRLLGARPSDTLELAGPMPARVATALDSPSRQAFLETYRQQTTAVRAAYDQLLAPTAGHEPPADIQDRKATESGERSRVAPISGPPRSKPDSRHSRP